MTGAPAQPYLPYGPGLVYVNVVQNQHAPLQIWHSHHYEPRETSSKESDVEPSYIIMPPMVEDSPKDTLPAPIDSQPWTIRQEVLANSPGQLLIDELPASHTSSAATPPSAMSATPPGYFPRSVEPNQATSHGLEGDGIAPRHAPANSTARAPSRSEASDEPVAAVPDAAAPQTLVDSSQVQSPQDPLPGPPNRSDDLRSKVQAPIDPAAFVSAVPAAAAPVHHLLPVLDVGEPLASHTSLENPLSPGQTPKQPLASTPSGPAASSASAATPPSAPKIDAAKGTSPQEHTPPTSIGSDTVSSCCASEVGGQVPRPLSPASAEPDAPPKPTRACPPAIPTAKMKARRDKSPELPEPVSKPARQGVNRPLRADGNPLTPPGNARPPSVAWQDMQHFPQIGTDGSATPERTGEAETSNLSSSSSNVHERRVLEQPDGGPAIAASRESDGEGRAAPAPERPSSLASTGSPSPTDFQLGAEPPADVDHHPVEVASSVMQPIEEEPPHVSPESSPTRTAIATSPEAGSVRTSQLGWWNLWGQLGLG